MTKAELIDLQKKERANILKTILASKSSKKIIIAGAGTGKTFTFGEVLKLSPLGANIAMTFIRLLRNDMEISLGQWAEVRTFHEYCKKILHKRMGRIELYPKLTKIIEDDAKYLGVTFDNFDFKFQMLDETGSEIGFYLMRGDYYLTVAFNDSVYRMLKELQNNSSIISKFDNILIDEFQDFNLLEVSFIDELEKFGNILIVGDDDQAVYESRFSSPTFLRKKYASKDYETFALPFCNRCTEVIIEATNGILKKAELKGYLKGRIKKRYECFIDAKDADNLKYPKITIAQLSTLSTVQKYINKKINEIPNNEINESWIDGKEYPTVLIVGAKQYLNYLYKNLKKNFQNIKFKQPENNDITLSEGYKYLINDINSNIGWRIVIIFFLRGNEIKKIIKETEKGKDICGLLDKKFVAEQVKIISLVTRLNKVGEDNNQLLKEIKAKLDDPYFTEIRKSFLIEDENKEVPDKTKPNILLTSFQGCKGLSAGFVFIVGANNGVIPKTPKISDVEICQLIVALTRTRKKCYILSEDRKYGPKDRNGNWIPKSTRSAYVNWIPAKCLEDLGNLRSSNI